MSSYARRTNGTSWCLSVSREVRRLGTATSHCSSVIVDIKVSTKLFHLTSRCPLHTVPEAIVADATSSGLHGRRLAAGWSTGRPWWPEKLIIARVLSPTQPTRMSATTSRNGSVSSTPDCDDMDASKHRLRTSPTHLLHSLTDFIPVYI